MSVSTQPNSENNLENKKKNQKTTCTNCNKLVPISKIENHKLSKKCRSNNLQNINNIELSNNLQISNNIVSNKIKELSDLKNEYLRYIKTLDASISQLNEFKDVDEKINSFKNICNNINHVTLNFNKPIVKRKYNKKQTTDKNFEKNNYILETISENN